MSLSTPPHINQSPTALLQCKKGWGEDGAHRGLGETRNGGWGSERRGEERERAEETESEEWTAVMLKGCGQVTASSVLARLRQRARDTRARRARFNKYKFMTRRVVPYRSAV